MECNGDRMIIHLRRILERNIEHEKQMFIDLCSGSALYFSTDALKETYKQLWNNELGQGGDDGRLTIIIS